MRASLPAFFLLLFFSFAFAACGDGTCSSGENFASCPADCDPAIVTVAVLEFDSSRTYMRGDEVFVKVRLTADGVVAGQADVLLTGFFGSVKLLDDGEHGDGKKYDAVYANSFTISDTASPGQKVLKITATKRGTSGIATLQMNVSTSIDVAVETSDERFVLGDIIEIQGNVKKGQGPVLGNVTIKFVFGGDAFKTVEVETDKDGLFSFSYRTSLIDPEGQWVIQAIAADEKNNQGAAEKTIGLYKEIDNSFYSVEFLEPITDLYSRGETVKFLVRVGSPQGAISGDLNVELEVPGRLPLNLEKIADGLYTLQFKIPYDFPLGSQGFVAMASVEKGGILQAGFSSKSLIVDRAQISVEQAKPEKNFFLRGETVNLEFEIFYEGDQAPVLNAIVGLDIGGTPLQLEEIARGVYAASYFVKEDAAGTIALAMDISDQSGNKGQFSTEFEVGEETSLLYLLGKNIQLVSAVAAVLVVAAIAGLFYYKKSSRKKDLGGRIGELNRLMADLKKRYYETGNIKTEHFKEMMGKYRQELDELEAKLKEAKK